MPVGRVLKVVAASLWVVFIVAIGVAEFLDRDLPTQWGTFTEQSRECQNGPRYSGCTVRGRWVSHDGRIVKADVVLVNAGLWMPWLMATGGVTFIVVQLRAGRRDSK